MIFLIMLAAAFVLPVILAMNGRAGHAVLNFFLCVFFFIPGLIHFMIVMSSVTNDRTNERRHREMIDAVYQASAPRFYPPPPPPAPAARAYPPAPYYPPPSANYPVPTYHPPAAPQPYNPFDHIE